jgi:hypothetical protein
LMSQGGAKPTDNLPIAESFQFFQQLRFGNSKILRYGRSATAISFWIEAMIFFSSSVSMGCLFASRSLYVNIQCSYSVQVSVFTCQVSRDRTED